MHRPSRDEIRADLIAIAARRFAVAGFEATSLRDIATEAGYSKAAVLYHFGCKDELLAAVVNERLDRVDATLHELEELPPGRPRDEAVIERLVGFLIAQRPVPPLVLNPSHDLMTALARLPVAERMQRTRSRLTDLLAGPDASLTRRVQVTAAMAGLHGAVAEYPDADEHALAAALTLFVRRAIDDDTTSIQISTLSH